MISRGSHRDDLAHLRRTLGGRFWLMTGIGTIAALLVLGIPTAVIPNILFSRMTPTEPANVAIWLASAPLIGSIFGSYAAPVDKVHRPTTDVSSRAGRLSLASVGSFLAIGCPLCNKLVVAALGVSGALNVFGPIQPLIGTASVALLGLSLVWRLRMRSRPCTACSDLTAWSG